VDAGEFHSRSARRRGASRSRSIRGVNDETVNKSEEETIMSTKDVEDILRQSDEQGETAAPEDDEEEETAAPEDDEEREETARVELEADDGDTGDINALRRRGRSTISLEEARTLQARARARGRRVGKVVTKQQAKKAAPAAPAAPPNLVRPGEAGRQLVDKWKRTERPFTVRHEGHYYYVAEIRFVCLGDANRAFLKVDRNEPVLFFDKAVGDDTTILGNPVKVNLRQTNFQRPSKNTYVASDFLIQTINMEAVGLRVKYEESALSVPGLGNAHDVLLGRGWVWDDSGLLLPKEIFHDLTRENLLYHSLRASSVLFFNWAKKQAGGNARTTTELIDNLQRIPDVTVKRLSHTSGGASALRVKDGYVFTDDPERSEYGQFTAKLEVQDDIVFPIKPIDLGGGTAVKPLEVGLYVQLSMNGIAFEPAARRAA
jgi:hypothetical protein